MRAVLSTFVALFCSTLSLAQKTGVEVSSVKNLGEREIVVEFATKEDGAPSDISIVYTEALTLNEWAITLVRTKQIRPGVAGVKQMGPDRYRASIAFPIDGDEHLQQPGFVRPKARTQTVPTYPFTLCKAGIVGGALLKIDIDEKAKVREVKVIKASNPEFGASAKASAKKWLFATPATLDGKPVRTSLFQMVIFELEGKTFAPFQWREAPLPSLDAYIVTAGLIPAN